MAKYKKLILIVLSSISFTLITVVIISFTYEDAVIKYLKNYLDKHLTTEIQVEKINFSLIKKFPKASVELKYIMAKSSTDLRKKDFRKTKTDTLLSAKSLFFEFSLPKLIMGEYKLKNISIENGRINLYTDYTGHTNFNIWENGSEQKKDDVNINLQNIIFSNVAFRYLNLKNDIDIITRSKKLHLHADFGKENHVVAKGNIMLKKLGIEKSINYVNKPVYTEIDLSYKKGNYHFNKSRISFEKSKVLFSGNVLAGEKVWIDLNFKSDKAFIKNLSAFFPVQLDKFNKDYTLSGFANISGSVKGFSSSTSVPVLNVDFLINNASVDNNFNNRKIDNILLKGNYLYKASQSFLKVDTFNAELDNSRFSGRLKLTGKEKPLAQIQVNSVIDAKELSQFLNLDTIQDVSGSIDASIFLSGRLSSFQNLTFKELLTFDREGVILLKDLSFRVKGTHYNLKNINGTARLENIIKLRDFTFFISDNDFNVNCNLSNFYDHFLNREPIYAEAEIHSTNLNLGELIKKENGKNTSGFISFPDSFSFKTNFSVDNLVYGKFFATDISGAVSYSPRIFQFHSFQLKSVEGSINGVATISQDLEDITKIDCAASLSKIDIQKLFYSFNNFTQDVILDKNLKGKLSGKVNVIASWDKQINLVKNSIEAYTDIEIQNGELIEYAPMLGLSKFIAVEELKDIKFKTLKNQIIIKDETITIPEMKINSSALNIIGSGTHKFDNNYDYRIQVHLSDLLAKKARKKKNELEEYGLYEEDGMSINIPIKIIGKGNDFDVSYDRKKAFTIFKQNINEEKQELKSLIKENNIPEKQNTHTDQKSNFIIKWDEENEEKDSNFEKKETNQKNESQFVIEWDEDDGTD